MTRRTFPATALVAALCACALAGSARAADDTPGDPWESFNRPIFWFNDRVLDRRLLEPLAVGWEFITPATLRVHLGQLFQNLHFPLRFANDLLQADVKQAGVELGRFAVNSTVGVVGFFDPASGWGLEKRDEDFGQTLGVWGVPSGPYLQLPFVGAGSPRDSLAGLLDLAFGGAPDFLIGLPVISTTERINSRALLLEDVRDAREASLDYYSGLRDAYVPRRRALVANASDEPSTPPDDLYEVPGDDE